MSSRINQSIKNIAMITISYFFSMLLTFITRTIFIRLLAKEYLGLNGLFTNLLSFLALAELGVGSAINFSLYKPLKENDTEKTKSLMQLYKHLYKIIGLVIIIVGFVLGPFLPYLIKDMPSDMPYIYWYYLLSVLNSAVSYFYSYKRSILVCDQKEYKSTIVVMVMSLVTKIGQIVVLFLFKSYMAYLFVAFFTTLAENIIISHIADKEYPYLRDKNAKKLPEADTNAIKKNTAALFMHRIGSTIVFATDNIIISKFLGLIEVGLYSNYSLIISAVDSLLSKVFRAITPSVGNLLINDDKEYVEDIFYKTLFINVWVYGFSAIAIFTLSQHFICLWVGENFLLSIPVLLVLVLNFYFTGVRRTVWIYKDASGNFWPDRYKPLVEGIVNLFTSIVLVLHYGMIGVFIGTTISTLFVSFWVEAYVLFKYYFNKKFYEYLKKQMIYLIEIIVIGFVTYWVMSCINNYELLGFIIKMLLCVLISNLLMYLIWRTKSEFFYFKKICANLLEKVKKYK